MDQSSSARRREFAGRICLTVLELTLFSGATIIEESVLALKGDL